MCLNVLKMIMIMITIMMKILPLASARSSSPNMSLPNCPDSCAGVTIPYPFGIGTGCYRDQWFAITCKNGTTNFSKKPYLSAFNLEFVTVDLQSQLLTVNVPINASNSKCPGQNTSTVWKSTTFTGSPFNVSRSYNEFTVVGCDNALLSYAGKTMAGCTSACIDNNATSTSTEEACYGIGCCQTAIPADLDSYQVTISGNNNGRNCTYAFIGQTGWFPSNVSNNNLHEIDYVPLTLDWTPKDTFLFSSDSFKTPQYSCFNPNEWGGIQCQCGWAYEGNPYIQNGCKVVEACIGCENDCERRNIGGELYCNPNNKTQTIIGASLGGGLLLLLLCGSTIFLYKYINRKRVIRRKKTFFKRNGGLLLQQKISSDQGMVDSTKVFSSHELEKATDNFNENRILGRGGQGTVYKGMLTDGNIVAIKKSMVVNVTQLEPFINEVVILSQINHRNIVKLLGCCLETEVPLLVYEYISNGNLFDFIRDQNQEFPLSWKKRLQIATEVAGALVYLHSSSSTPIYHRDIKSTNILLDEMFRAKLADFGTSRSITIEQTHLTTVVQGTFGYLDPEYFQSSQFTDKSDVYSYGVVLVELLTGQKAISLSESEEERGLATRFISYMEDMRLFDLIDSHVKEEAEEEEILVVAGIAKRCLYLSGKKRPTMKQVMTELERITASTSISNCQNQNKDEDSIIIDEEHYIDYRHSSMNLSSTQESISIHTTTTTAASDDEDALLINVV